MIIYLQYLVWFDLTSPGKLLVRRAVPADIGQGVTLGKLQGRAVGIKQMTSLAADAEGESLAHPNMAITSDLSGQGGVIL